MLDATRRKTVPEEATHEELLVSAVRGGKVTYAPPPLHEVVSSSSIDLIFLRISASGLARRLRGTPFAQLLLGKDTEIFGQAKAGDRSQLWVQPGRMDMLKPS